LAPPRRPLPPGLYDEPVTRELDRALTALPSPLRLTAELDPHRAPLALGHHLHTRLVRALQSLGGAPEDRTARQVDLVNRVLSLVEHQAREAGVDEDDHVAPPARALEAILAPVDPPAVPTPPTRPSIPLSSSDLLVNGPHDLSLGPALQHELPSADRVDLLCSFLKWSGLRLVEDPLRAFALRRGGPALRVLTTVYMGATERRALDALAEMGAQIRVSYDDARTRLHAKAWLFHRESGTSTGYVGSSNLSAAAMLDGLEWNVRLSTTDNAAILAKFGATFDQYWADESFRPYVPAEFDEVVQQTKRSALAPYLFLDVRPQPHQAEILEELAAERARGHHKNLVVAATGTGKTIVAALDYKRLRAELPRDRLLFVAHRREILDQSLKTFQVVLRDGAFGEMLRAGFKPDHWTHVFASVQSLDAGMLREIPRDHFDVVIVDEFHHAAARTYDELLRHLQPRVLLGLTATPERTDGKSILGWFDDRIASELRLWKALDQGLLSPFQYFGIGAAPDASGVKWSAGRYDSSELSNLYTADHLFALRVLQETQKKVRDIQSMRALGFCVDVAHAEFMARFFSERGVRSAAVSAATPSDERAGRLAALRTGDLQCLFSVDLFNEGVDLPDVDTLLFLRPTESATVFLQQLGRGLRRSDQKECLTVLDFVGGAHRRFRFDLRYRALVGGTRQSVRRAVEQEFPSLPSGCSIQLDRIAKEVVLQNIERHLGGGSKELAEDLASLVGSSGTRVPLRRFLDEAGVELEDVYAGERSYTTLLRQAGATLPPALPDDTQLARAFARMLHVDDSVRLDGFRALLRGPRPKPDDADPIQRLLFALLGFVRRPYTDLGAAWDVLWSSAMREELLELLDLLADRTRSLTSPLPGRLADLVLQVHATYALDEVLAGIDERTTKGGVKRIQTGVFRSERLRADLLFVTLEKSEKEYSPTTLYNDFAISPTRFHWETQSNCHAGTETGQRYLRAKRDADDRVLLFVRARRTDPRGVTMPYAFLGEAFCAEARGGRPMQIEWDLATPMPAGMFMTTKVAAG